MLDKLSICATPTPLHEMWGVAEQLGCQDVFVKRDDLLGRGLGGNKLRKLEYILAAARREGASTVITTGGFESNHIALLSVAAHMYQLRPVIVLMGPKGKQPRNTNNNFLSRLGVETHVVDYIEGDLASQATVRKEVDLKIEELSNQFARNGETVFLVPEGGNCLEGTYAFFSAFNELQTQMVDRGIHRYDICLPVGSGSTFAGLWCGIRKAGADVGLIGISIALKKYRCRKQVIKAAGRVCPLLSVEPPAMDELGIYDQFIGAGYGCPTVQSRRGVSIALECEGLLLDHTYTGKALGAMLELLESNDCPRAQGKPVVFWHTGGVPGAIDWLSDAPARTDSISEA